jgi:regulator of RNase E activity RraA
VSAEPRAAQVSDALDAIGLRRQSIGGLARFSGAGTVAGRAFTMQCAPAAPRTGERYAGLLAALDAVSDGDLVLVASGPSDICAVWGELLSTSCRAHGAVGTVTDGLIRDSVQIAALGYPVFAAGTSPLDIDGRLDVTAHGVEVTIGGVPVSAGDTVVADDDGVVVVPRGVAGDVLERAAAKARGEDDFRAAVAGGESATEAFRRFDVL